MNTNKVVGTKLCIITIVSALCALVLTPGVVCAADIFVGPGETYTTIQQAVDNATAGDTIIVRNGTYTENVNVNKRLTIKSENGSANCIVQAANPNDHVFEVTADYVNISGFTVTNATGNVMSGIYLSSQDHCNISDNNASDNYYGIFLFSSDTNSISNNIASNSQRGIYLYFSCNNNNINGNTAFNNYDNGINLDSSSNNNLTDNTASNNSYHGINLRDSSNNTLTDNTASNNSYHGINLDSSNYNNLTGNTASNNRYGILLFISSNNNNLTDNTAFNNYDNGICLIESSTNTLTANTASNSNYGIRLASSSYNTLTGNTASNNSYNGIHLYESSTNTLTANTASNNSYGIYLQYSSNNNTIYNNYFSNTNNAYDEGNNIWNITKTEGRNIIGGPNLGGNYWSDYAGEDTDVDALGDTLIPFTASGKIQNGGDYHPLVRMNTNITIPTATGTGNATITTSSGYFCNATALNASYFPSVPDSFITFFHGFFNITICGLNDTNLENVTINFTFPSAIPTDAEFWKYNASNGTWYPFPFGDNDGDNVISITITDNGPGDHNPANGTINDPNGIGWRQPAEAPVPVPAVTPIGLVALVGLLPAIAVLTMRRKRR